MAVAAKDIKSVIEELRFKLKKKGTLAEGIEGVKKLINEELQRIANANAQGNANSQGNANNNSIDRAKYKKLITAIIFQIKAISKSDSNSYRLELLGLCECLLLILTPQNINKDTINDDFRCALNALMVGIEAYSRILSVYHSLDVPALFQRFSNMVTQLRAWFTALEHHRVHSQANPKFNYNELIKEYVTTFIQEIDSNSQRAYRLTDIFHHYHKTIDNIERNSWYEAKHTGLYLLWNALLDLKVTIFPLETWNLRRVWTESLIDFISILPKIITFHNLDSKQKFEFITGPVNEILKFPFPSNSYPLEKMRNLSEMLAELNSPLSPSMAFQVLESARQHAGSAPASPWEKGIYHIQIIMLAITKQIKEFNGVDTKQFRENLLTHLKQAQCLNEVQIQCLDKHVNCSRPQCIQPQFHYNWAKKLFKDLVLAFEQQEYDITLEILNLTTRFLDTSKEANATNLKAEVSLLRALCLMKSQKRDSKRDSKEDSKQWMSTIIENVQKTLSLLNLQQQNIILQSYTMTMGSKMLDYFKDCRDFFMNNNEFQASLNCNQLLYGAYFHSLPHFPPSSPRLEELQYGLFNVDIFSLQLFLKSGNYLEAGDSREVLTTQYIDNMLTTAQTLNKNTNSVERKNLMKRAALQLLEVGKLLIDFKDNKPAHVLLENAFAFCAMDEAQLKIRILLRFTLSLTHFIVSQKEQKMSDEAAETKNIQENENRLYYLIKHLIESIVEFPMSVEDSALFRQEISTHLLMHQSNPLLMKNTRLYLLTLEVSLLCLGLNPAPSQLLFDALKQYVTACVSLPMNPEFNECRKQAYLYVQRYQQLFKAQNSFNAYDNSNARSSAPNFLQERFLGMLQKFEADLKPKTLGLAPEVAMDVAMDLSEDSGSAHSAHSVSAGSLKAAPIAPPKVPISEDAKLNAEFDSVLKTFTSFAKMSQEGFFIDSDQNKCTFERLPILFQEVHNSNEGFLSQVLNPGHLYLKIDELRTFLFVFAIMHRNLEIIKLFMNKRLVQEDIQTGSFKHFNLVSLAMILGNKALLQYALSIGYSLDSIKAITYQANDQERAFNVEACHLTSDPEILNLAQASKDMSNLFTCLPAESKELNNAGFLLELNSQFEYRVKLKSELMRLSNLVSPLQNYGYGASLEDPLTKCIRAGNVDLLLLLLDLPLDWSRYLSIALTNIHRCPRNKIKEFVSLLKPYTHHHPAQSLTYLLPVAIEWGDLELFIWLHKTLGGAFEGRAPIGHYTSLQMAIEKNNPEAVKYIFQELPQIKAMPLVDCFKKADPALAVDGRGMVPFLMAVQLKRMDIIPLFLQAYAGDPQLLDAVTLQGNNALIVAFGAGYDTKTLQDLIPALIQAGVNLHRHFGSDADTKGVVEHFRIPDPILAKIYAAINLIKVLSYDSPTTIGILSNYLKEGAFLTQRINGGYSPLHIIAEKFPDLFSLVLELEEFEKEVVEGQDGLLLITDNSGKSPRMLASEKGHLIADFLCALHSARVAFTRCKNYNDNGQVYSKTYQNIMTNLMEQLHKLPEDLQKKCYFKLGRYLEETFGDHKLAIEYLSQYIDLKSENDLRAPHYYLGLAYFHSGNLATAESVAELTAKAKPDSEKSDGKMDGGGERKMEVETGLDEDEEEAVIPEITALYHFEEARDYKEAAYYRRLIQYTQFKEVFGYKSLEQVPDPLEKRGKLDIYKKLHAIKKECSGQKNSYAGTKRKREDAPPPAPILLSGGPAPTAGAPASSASSSSSEEPDLKKARKEERKP